jgi:hypothetical protein
MTNTDSTEPTQAGHNTYRGTPESPCPKCNPNRYTKVAKHRIDFNAQTASDADHTHPHPYDARNPHGTPALIDVLVCPQCNPTGYASLNAKHRNISTYFSGSPEDDYSWFPKGLNNG